MSIRTYEFFTRTVRSKDDLQSYDCIVNFLTCRLADTLPDVQYFRLPRAATNASMYYVPSRGGFAVV